MLTYLPVSGATKRYDVVNFPPTGDKELLNSLRSLKVDLKGRIITTENNHSHSADQFVFKTEKECQLIVDKLGSHFGDLTMVVKQVVLAKVDVNGKM